MPATDQRLLALGVPHACTCAQDGDMKDTRARTAFLSRQAVAPERVLLLCQRHTDSIITVQTGDEAEKIAAGPAPVADAWVLSAPGWGAAVLTADCAPVLLWDEGAQLLGAVHAGWRGAASGIAAKTARRMLELGARAPLKAFIGPHIAPCCFEVGAELEQAFPPETFLLKDGRRFLDLGLAVRLQLEGAGLAPADIAGNGHCTHCSPDLFSYRRDKTCGRLMTYIFKK